MFEKILMPSDGSEYALRAATYGADIAKKYNSQLTLLYVVELPPVIGIPPSDELQEAMRQDLAGRGREALDKTREIYERMGIPTVDDILFGSAVPSIINFARDGAFDLVVISSRGAGTGAIEQILIGSVAEGILHGAPCPVLMIRPC